MERTASDALQMLRTTLDDCTEEQDMIEAYASYSKTYDIDYLKILKYILPKKVAEVLIKNTSCKKNAKLLDVGCGTGLIGENLRKFEFEGILHGIDASTDMLNIALNKKVYDEVFAQYLTVGSTIKAAPGVLYDGVICVGTILKGHLQPEILIDFLPLLVSDGLVVVTVTNTSYNQKVTEQMMETLEKLKDSKKMYDVEICEAPSYEIDSNKVSEDFNKDDFNTSSTARIFIMRKV